MTRVVEYVLNGETCYATPDKDAWDYVLELPAALASDFVLERLQVFVRADRTYGSLDDRHEQTASLEGMVGRTVAQALDDMDGDGLTSPATGRTYLASDGLELRLVSRSSVAYRRRAQCRVEFAVVRARSS